MNPHQRGSTTGTTGTASTLAGWGGVRPMLTPSRPLCFSEQHPGAGTHISNPHLALGVLCWPPRCCTHPSTVAIKHFYSQQ